MNIDKQYLCFEIEWGLTKSIVSPQNLHRRKQRIRLWRLLPQAKFGRSDRTLNLSMTKPRCGLVISSSVHFALLKPFAQRQARGRFFVAYHFHQQQRRGAIAPLLCCWSKWQDSNLQHLAPKETYTDFLRDFYAFSGLFSPKTVLSSALTSTVST